VPKGQAEMMHTIKPMRKERFAYLLNVLERPMLFSTSHLAGLATTLAYCLAISMSTNDVSLYFWKVEWLVTRSIECDQKDYFSIVDFELFWASSGKQLIATPRSVVSLSRIMARSCSEACVMVNWLSKRFTRNKLKQHPVYGQIACSNGVRHRE
jgi:hypothetical protein